MQVVTRHDLPGVLRQHDEHAHDPGIQLLAAAGSGYLARPRLNRKLAELEAELERLTRMSVFR
jgi:hypothetical protein